MLPPGITAVVRVPVQRPVLLEMDVCPDIAAVLLRRVDMVRPGRRLPTAVAPSARVISVMVAVPVQRPRRRVTGALPVVPVGDVRPVHIPVPVRRRAHLAARVIIARVARTGRLAAR